MLSSREARHPVMRWSALVLIILAGLPTVLLAATDVQIVGRSPVRKGPDIRAAVIDVVETGAFVTVQSEGPAPWFRVATRTGGAGWIAATRTVGGLKVDERLAGAPGLMPPEVVVYEAAEVRSAPASGRAVVGTIDAGTTARVVNQYGAWVQLASPSGVTGWADALSIVTSGPGPEALEAAAAMRAAALARIAQAPIAVSPLAGRETAASEGAGKPHGADAESAVKREAESAAKAERVAAEQRARDEASAGERAAKAETAAKREAERVAKAESEAAARAERDAAKAEKSARSGAPATERSSEKTSSQDASAAKAAQAAERTKAAEQRAAEKQQLEAARQAAREARVNEAEEQARRKAEEAAAKTAARDAGTESAPVSPKTASAEEKAAVRDATQTAAAAAKQRKDEEAAAAKQRKDQEAAEAAAAREAAKATREAEKLAKKETTSKPAKPKAAEETAQPVQENESAKESAQSAKRTSKAEEEAARHAAKAAQEETARAEKKTAKNAEGQSDAKGQAAKDARRVIESQTARRQAEPLPLDIPPAITLPVDVRGKAPSEAKPDPKQSPLVREGAVTASRVASTAPVSAAPVAKSSPDTRMPSGFQPYDDKAQAQRSVDALHADKEGALELSGAPRKALETGKAGKDYVTESGKRVPARTITEIVARVNQEVLTNTELEQRVRETTDEINRTDPARARSMSPQQLVGRALNQMLEELLLIDEGKLLNLSFDKVYEQAKQEFMSKAGIKDDLELLQVLDASGRTWDDFHRELIRRRVPGIVLRSQVTKNIIVTDEEVQTHYRLHQADWVQEDCVRLREIVLQPEPQETTADFDLRLSEILKRLYAGEDFCELARRWSKSVSADKCGILDQCFAYGALDEKVALQAFAMRPGDIEPVRTEWGYHVLRLEEHRPRSVPALTEVQEEIVERLRRDKARDLIQDYIDGLRQAALIEVAPEYQAFLGGSASGSELLDGGPAQ